MKNRVPLLVFSSLLTATLLPQDDFAQKAKITWKKITRFAQRNKEKIIAGGIAALAAGLGIGAVTYVNRKANKAIKEAGLEPSMLSAQKAKTFMVTIGLLGYKEGIKKLAEDKELRAMMDETPEISEALAHFWGVKLEEFSKQLRYEINIAGL